MNNKTLTDLLQLKKTVEAISPLSLNGWELFACKWKPLEAKRKEILTVANHTEKYLYYVLEGIQRVYYVDEQGREATIVFTYFPSFGGVVDSLLLQQPSKYYYETLTPSRFLRIPFHDLNLLITTQPEIERMILKGLTFAFTGILERLVELQSFSSEEKFKSLLQRSPHILQLVPQKYLANYLGIDATNFSKMLNKIKI
jgi:CRP-like cAMP-binding protein